MSAVFYIIHLNENIFNQLKSVILHVYVLCMMSELKVHFQHT
jgi:hypothetical protein